MRHPLVILGVVAGLLLAVPLAGFGQEIKKPEATQAPPGDFPKPKPVKPVADIRVTDVFADACRLWFRVENSGNVTIDKVLRERVWVDGVLVNQNQMHYLLKPGAVFAHGVGADPGVKIAGLNKAVKVMIDADNALVEGDEANNIKEVSLSCKVASAAGAAAAGPVGALQAMPDLSCSQANLFFEPEGESRHYYIQVTVLNGIHDGRGREAGPFRVRATYEDRTVTPWVMREAVYSVPGLEMGTTHVQKHLSVGVYPPQAYFRLVKVEVDIDGAVTESNEGNNTRIF